MNVLAIDPGSEHSALVLFDVDLYRPVAAKILPSREAIGHIIAMGPGAMAVEMIASYGMAVGKSVFETCVWIGRFIQAYRMTMSEEADLITRMQVKMHICQHPRAKDSNIRQALIDKFGGDRKAIGGIRCGKCKGKGWFGAGRPVCPKCGGEKWDVAPGPLRGITKDMWSALAVAVTWADQHRGAR